MKKIIAALLACTCIITGLCSCAAETAPESESSSRMSRISTAPLDPAIIGSWYSEMSGYRFQEDRKVSLIMDMSDSVHFTKNGAFMQNVELVDGDVKVDGDKISISHKYDEFDEVLDIMTLERISGKSGETDGTYKMVSGSYIKLIAGQLGMLPEEVTIEAAVEGEKFNITVVDYCDYEASKGVLEMFSAKMEYVDKTATSVKYTYEIDGDTLSLTYTGKSAESGDKMTEVLTRVKD